MKSVQTKTKYLSPKIKKTKIKVNFFSVHNRFKSSYDFDGLIIESRLLASGCFIADTRITNTKGKEIDVQKVKKGDLVISYDLRRKKYIKNKVVELLVHENDQSGYFIINDELKVTQNHRFWVNDYSWKRADQLRIGDSLQMLEENKLMVKKVEWIESSNTVYNLHLEKEPHYFFANKILVHNAGAEFKKS